MPKKKTPCSNYSTEAGQRAVEFIQLLRHTKGRWKGVPFLMSEWQREDIIRPLFGTLDPNTHKDSPREYLRRYRKAFIAVAKKNGKTGLAAAIAAFLLFADNEGGAEVYSGAASRDQATLVYRELKGMVQQVPALNNLAKCYDSSKRIVVQSTNSFYQALSADADYSDGINPSGYIVDELHRHKNRELYDLLNEGSGTREQPLGVIITTAGVDRSSVCYEEWEYARKVANGLVEDPTFFSYLREVPKNKTFDDIAKDESLWYLANPALGDFLDLEDLRKSVREAKEKPAKQNSVCRLRFNQWTSAETRWLTMAQWDACGGLLNKSKLKGRTAFGGLDLASTTDFAAWQVVVPWEGVEGYDVLTRLFIPEVTLEGRTRQKDWLDSLRSEGFLHVTPGDVIDFDFIKAQILKDAAQFRIVEIGYDPWSATQIATQLQGEGLTCVPVRQGFGTLSEPAKLLERLVRDRKLNHGGHPLLRWMADLVMIETDAQENIKPSKKHSTDRIDGIAATVTALERAMHAEKPAEVKFIAFGD